MMGTAGVGNPDGSDRMQRTLVERVILVLLKWLVPPHADNELTAQYLHEHRDTVDWSVVRPTWLIDGEVSDYEIFDDPTESIFGKSVSTRANVADLLVQLAVNEETWQKYKHKMPVLLDTKRPDGNSDSVPISSQPDEARMKSM